MLKSITFNPLTKYQLAIYTLLHFYYRLMEITFIMLLNVILN